MMMITHPTTYHSYYSYPNIDTHSLWTSQLYFSIEETTTIVLQLDSLTSPKYIESPVQWPWTGALSQHGDSCGVV